MNTEFRVRDILIPSRFVLAPINTGMAESGQPTPHLIEFHRLRSGNDIGISYVGNAAIGPEFITNDGTLFFQNGDSESWRELPKTIAARGSVPGIQLACTISRTAKSTDEMAAQILTMPSNAISRITERFAEVAVEARSFGFRVVQIHAAHGYFLSQLLNRVVNQRLDRYSFGNLDFIQDIISSIRRNAPDLAIDIRLSLIDGVESRSEELAYRTSLVERIAALDVDIISISNGFKGANKLLIYPPHKWGHGPYVELVTALAARYPDKLWCTAGGIWDLKRISHGAPNVMYAIGRQLLADPETISKSRNDRRGDIRLCTECGRCHYHGRGLKHIECPVSTDLQSKELGFVGLSTKRVESACPEGKVEVIVKGTRD